MVPADLLQMATELAESGSRRPRRSYLCRAVSNAYYALFHCLALTCADRLAGGTGTVGKRPMWRRMYRALEHRQARTRCENVPSWFPAGVKLFAQTFAELQNRRHFADYDPDHPVRKSEVLADIVDARRAIDRFLATPASVRRDFAIHVLTRERANA